MFGGKEVCRLNLLIFENILTGHRCGDAFMLVRHHSHLGISFFLKACCWSYAYIRTCHRNVPVLES